MPNFGTPIQMLSRDMSVVAEFLVLFRLVRCFIKALEVCGNGFQLFHSFPFPQVSIPSHSHASQTVVPISIIFPHRHSHSLPFPFLITLH